jgi:hypothetical protein
MRWPTSGYSTNANRLMPISLGYEMRKFLNHGTNQVNQGAYVAVGWPVANRAFYFPFMLEEPMYVTEGSLHNTGSVAGSLDLGVYSVDGVRLVSSGLVTQAGVGLVQRIPLTDTLLDRGVFYAALMATSTSTTTFRFNGGLASDWLVWGALQEDTAGSLPAVATFTTNQTPYLPYFSLHSRSF